MSGMDYREQNSAASKAVNGRARGYFSIPRWGEYQHYKDRRPPWIKLHNALLEDYEFQQLPDITKAHLQGLWLLASRLQGASDALQDGCLPDDAAWLAAKIGADSVEALAASLPVLTSCGFLTYHSASGVLADCKQSAIPERETEGEAKAETEGEKERARKTRRSRISQGELDDLISEEVGNLAVHTRISAALWEWREYRREAGIRALTSGGWTKLVKKWAGDPDGLQAAVDHSIAGSYQGLYAPKDGTKAKTREQKADDVVAKFLSRFETGDSQ